MRDEMNSFFCALGIIIILAIVLPPLAMMIYLYVNYLKNLVIN